MTLIVITAAIVAVAMAVTRFVRSRWSARRERSHHPR